MTKTARFFSVLMATTALTFSAFANKPGTKMKIDPAQSLVKWVGSKTVVKSSHNGEVKVKEGLIEIADGKITGGNIIIDMASITNADLAGSPDYQQKLVGHLKSADFFDVAKHPTATFKILSSEKKSDTEVVLKGELTMIGKTNPIEVPAKIAMKGDSATGEAKFKIDRTKWGLKYGSGNFFKELTADKIISDEIEFEVKLAAKK